MITFFSTGNPFIGQAAIIQCNALKSCNYSDCTHRLTRSSLLQPTFWRKERNKIKAFLSKTLIYETSRLRRRLGLRQREHELTQ